MKIMRFLLSFGAMELQTFFVIVNHFIRAHRICGGFLMSIFIKDLPVGGHKKWIFIGEYTIICTNKEVINLKE